MSASPPPLRRVLCGIAIACLAAGCVYDHRIVQAVQARRARAREAEGAEVGSGGAPATVKYVASLRVHVGPRYRAAHAGWRGQVVDWVDSASGIVGPEYGLRLDVNDLRPWEPECDAAELATCLRALQQADAGDGVHWVIGIVGAVPRFTSSFDELGMASTPGKHLVLRDLSNPEERAVIARAFPTHTAARREQIHARRSHHKRLAVLLHELGHTLGAIHTRRRDALLYPAYDDQMSAFSDGNDELIRAGLRDRFSEEGGYEHSRRALAGVIDAELVANERERLQAWYEQRETAEAQASAVQAVAAEQRSHPFVVAGEEGQLLVGLSEADRAAYRQAAQATHDGFYGDAWDAIVPLVEPHAVCHAVQHLACGLAMSLGSDPATAARVCERAQATSP